MAVRYEITLNVNEPNNNVGLIKIRQSDEETQTLAVQVLDGAVPKSFEGLQPFFCVSLGDSEGLGIVEQRVDGPMDKENGRLEYTLNKYDWQRLGRQTAYFSFRKIGTNGKFYQVFSTRDFYYEVTKSIFSDGVKELHSDGSTYIWQFEDLKRRLEEFIASGQNDWQEFVNQNKEILEALDPSGELLNQINEAKGDYKSLAERLDNQFNSYLIDSEIDIAGGTQQAQVDSLENLKGRIDKNKFNLLFQTDLHYDEGRQSYKLANHMLNHLNNALALDGSVDAIVFGGDNIDGYQTDKRANLKHLEQFCTKALYSAEESDVFILLGNHDDGSIRTADFGGVMPKAEIINEDEFKKYFMTSEKLNGEIRDEDSLYFYKDYSDKKIRLIGLNSVDVSEETDSDGNILYPRQNYCGYREEQLKWLANVALQNVPNDYHTMIVTHVHLSESDKDNGNGTFEYHPNHDVLIKIIDSFKGGLITELKETKTGFVVDFVVDFSEQGPREFIGFFCGHCHKNFLTQAGTFNVYWNDLSMTRSDSDFGTTSEDSFNVISVDTTTKTVNILGYGRSDDLTFTY
jgi:predicted MPP superfamily phosphohydrolase